MEDKIKELIEEGQNYQFNNNCYRNQNGVFSRPSTDLLSWIACVDDLIIQSFGKESSPYKLLQDFDKTKLNGFYQDKFDIEKNKLIAALQACLRIEPKKIKQNLNTDFLLSAIFEKFHLVVKQLRNRHNNRTTLDINDEYDVQDLLHSLLKLFFNDIRAEECTPSYAGGASRMDFLLKEEKIVIEVKKTRKGLNDKELGKQLIEDKAKYKSHPDCKKLICFTYDPDGRICNPNGIASDLNSSDKDFIVEIVIKP